MCRRVTCERCNKPTFAGCGAHIEQVLRDVPQEQRCKCREQPQDAHGAGAVEPKKKSWFGW